MAVLNNNALVGASGKGGTGAITTPQRSLRFNSADSSFLSRTPAAGNRKTWTWSGWIKKVNNTTSRQFIFNADVTSNNSTIEFKDNAISVFDYNSGAYQWQVVTSAVFRDNSAWLHLVVAVDTTQAAPADRVKVYVNGIQQVFSTANYPSPDYQSKFNSTVEHRIGSLPGDTTFNLDGYLANIHFIDGQALDPSAFAYTDPATGRWEPKAYAGSYSGNSFYLDFSDNSAATAATLGADRSGLGNNWVPNNFTANASATLNAGIGSASAALFNGSDTKAYWRSPITITGISVPSGASFGYRGVIEQGNPVPTHTILKNGTQIGSFTGTEGTNNWIASTNYTNNQGVISQAILPSDTVVITSNVNAWHGIDRIIINGSPIIIRSSDVDSLRDHPTSAGTSTGLGGEVSGNYCTLNPLANPSGATLSNGNLDWSSTAAQNGACAGTIYVSSGKWYWEVTDNSGANALYIGITKSDDNLAASPGTTPGGYYYIDIGSAYTYNNNNLVSYGSTWASGDVIGVALNMDAGTLVFYKNGVSQGTAFTGLSGAFAPSFGDGGSSTAAAATLNAGQRAFAYTAPSGFKALCDTNMTQPTIVKPATVMGIVQYTGNNSTQTITGLDFNPDLIWSKSKSGTFGHGLFDSVRGVSRALASHSTDAEGVGAAGTGVTAFNSNGFSLGPDSGAFTGSINYTGSSQVAWCWDAGSTAIPKVYGAAASVSNTAALATTLISTASPSTVGSSYQNYDIDLQVSVTSAQIKFTYTANPIETLVSADGTTWISKGSTSQSAGATATVTHGSAFRYIRYYYSGGNWNQGFQFINNTSGSINSTALVNASAGFSIVTYTGNGSSGATVGHGLGVTPQMVVLKQRTGTAESWRVYHVGVNDLSKTLYLNQTVGAVSNTERISGVSSTTFTLSTGFAGVNASGDTYVAYCFAPVAGYSSFGSYTGNGATGWPNADGPFVYLGFRPKFILLKCTSQAENWVIYDSVRETYNFVNDKLLPNSSVAESTNNNHEIDFLSNGFKVRNNNGEFNQSSGTYIYAAFAESPFQYARAR